MSVRVDLSANRMCLCLSKRHEDKDGEHEGQADCVDASHGCVTVGCPIVVKVRATAKDRFRVAQLGTCELVILNCRVP